MNYRYHTERCPHGFAKFIRCEQCEGKWEDKGKRGRDLPEPQRLGYPRHVRVRGYERPRTPVSYKASGRGG